MEWNASDICFLSPERDKCEHFRNGGRRQAAGDKGGGTKLSPFLPIRSDSFFVASGTCIMPNVVVAV